MVVEKNAGEFAMKVLRLAAIALAGIFALAAAPAFAQMGGGGDGGPHVNLVPEFASKTPEQKEEDEVRDRAYRESLRKIPEAKGPSDPWGTVRAADAPKAASPAKPRTKTGSTAN